MDLTDFIRLHRGTGGHELPGVEVRGMYQCTATGKRSDSKAGLGRSRKPLNVPGHERMSQGERAAMDLKFE